MTSFIGPIHLQPAQRSSLAQSVRQNVPLVILSSAMVVLLLIALAGLLIDPRVITGAPAWMKPAKFAISIAIYAASLLWLLRFVPERPKLVAIISWGALFGFATEMLLITMQVLRGTTSHFNRETPFDAAVFTIMGGVIVGMWLLTLVVAVLLFRRNFAAPSIVWGVRMGLVAALFGMAVAFLMPQPTPAQEALMDATGASPVIGAHAVGVADGGPGLPVVGWSTEGGDLRVAHFVGMHGLQALPLVGWLLASFAPAWLTSRGRARLSMIAGLAWMAMTGLLVWQAQRGQSVVAPDSLTLGASIGAMTIAGAAALGILLHARKMAPG